MNGVLFLFIELLKENAFINITSPLLLDCTCFVGDFLFLRTFLYVLYNYIFQGWSACCTRDDFLASFMLRVAPRVRYGRLPRDNETTLRGLGPPFSHFKIASSVSLCKNASTAACSGDTHVLTAIHRHVICILFQIMLRYWFETCCIVPRRMIASL